MSKLTTPPEFPLKAGQWDAIWVLLGERSEARPLESPVLRDLDWRLQGLLSRYVLMPEPSGAPLTFVPVEPRSGVRFLVLDPGKGLGKKSLDAVCRGIGAKRVLVWPENPALAKWLEKQWGSLEGSHLDIDELAWGDDSLAVDRAGSESAP